jgi:hypothetical protein
MQDTFENPETPEPRSKFSPITVAMGLLVAAAIVLSVYFLFEPFRQNAVSVQQSVRVNMNPAEQDYIKKIEISNLAMSRAENFIHQEVTTLNGEIYNSGELPVLALSLTAEFADDMNQIVLRETRPVLLNPRTPLKPGEHRSFEISFEHVPPSWNVQTPAVHVSRLQLPAQKP